jgi:hypothetical protein
MLSDWLGGSESTDLYGEERTVERADQRFCCVITARSLRTCSGHVSTTVFVIMSRSGPDMSRTGPDMSRTDQASLQVNENL